LNVLKPMPEMPEADDRVVPVGRDTALPPAIVPGAGRKTLRMFLVAALLVGGGVAFGMWRHSLAEAEVNATSKQRRGIVPAVRVTTVHANDGMTMAFFPPRPMRSRQPKSWPASADMSPSATSTLGITLRRSSFSVNRPGFAGGSNS
jgi:hypothetical protein